MHRPTLSLVSKTFQSLIASRELQVTRALIKKPEKLMYFCIKHWKNPKPLWFILSPTPKQETPIPIPFPCEYPQYPSIVTIGSKIYIIGGFINEERSRKMFLLDCQAHEWHTLPEMLIPRGRSAVEVIDGKIYVIGGCTSDKSEHWGEFYDLNTQTWKRLLSPKTLILAVQKITTFTGRVVMSGKVYVKDGLQFYCQRDVCLVDISNNKYCQIIIYDNSLRWYEESRKGKVTGLEGLFPEAIFAISGGGRRVTIWWKTKMYPSEGRQYDIKECKTEIRCAEILLERRGFNEVRGFVEWSKHVFTFDGFVYCADFLLHSSIITH